MASISKKLAERMRQYHRGSPSKAKLEKYAPETGKIKLSDNNKEPDRELQAGKESQDVDKSNSVGLISNESEVGIETYKRKLSDDTVKPNMESEEKGINADHNGEERNEVENLVPSKRLKIISDSETEENENTEELEEENEEDSEQEDREPPIVVTNVMSKTFTIDLSREVKDYVKDLSEQALSPKPPTLYKLKMLTKEALRHLLKYNDRPIYTELSKNQLAAMVLEYMKIGCPPRCPKCKRGALRFSNGKKKNGKRYFWCPGSTKDGIHFLNCTFRADRSELDRIPWRTPP